MLPNELVERLWTLQLVWKEQSGKGERENWLSVLCG